MINVGNSVLLTGVIVTAGTFAADQSVSGRTIVGGAFLGIGLLTLAEVNYDLASKFAFLILLTAAFNYVPSIAYSLGLIKEKPTAWEWN